MKLKITILKLIHSSSKKAIPLRALFIHFLLRINPIRKLIISKKIIIRNMDLEFLSFIIVFSLLIFSVNFILLYKNYITKDNLYIIIPILCFTFWALNCIYYLNTELYSFLGVFYDPDFRVFYYAGKQIFKDPKRLYRDPRYVYLPSFAIFFAFTFSLLPLQISYYAFYIFSFITGILAILEFNKILILMDVKQKFHRFIFLFIISNGYFIWIIFFFNQFKFLVFLILLLIIKREIYYRKEGKVKNKQYYILTYGLFIFMLGMSPFFIFLLFIYIFFDIRLKEMFNRRNIEKYLIIIVWFTIQNITFFLYPSQIFQVLKGYNRPVREVYGATPIYLMGIIELNSSEMRVVNNIYTGILTIITLILILIKKMNIEKKISFFLLTYIFFGVVSHPLLSAYICFSFVLLLFVPFLKQNVKGWEFIKKNNIFLIGISSILGIFLYLRNVFTDIFLQMILELGFGVFGLYGLFVLHMIMLICLFLLYMKKYYDKNNDIKNNNFKMC